MFEKIIENLIFIFNVILGNLVGILIITSVFACLNYFAPKNVAVDDPFSREVNGIVLTGDLARLDFASPIAYEKFVSKKKENLDTLKRTDFTSEKAYDIFVMQYRSEPTKILGDDEPPGKAQGGLRK